MHLALDPRSDIVFRLLFGHPSRSDLLIALLEAVLKPDTPIASVELLDPTLPKTNVAERGLALDLRLRLSDGRLIDVEMQVALHGGLRERILAYWAKLFVSQLTPGDEYVKLHPCVSVIFLGECLLPSQRACSKFQVLEVTDGTKWSEAFELHVIELPKVLPAAHDPLSRWARFFQTQDDNELEQLTHMDPNIAKAFEAIKEMANDPDIRETVRLRELANINWRHSHACAIEEGLLRGREEGRSEGREEGRSEGREEGRSEGQRQALLANITQLAAAFGVSCEPSRKTTLETMTKEELDTVFAHLLAHRAWP